MIKVTAESNQYICDAEKGALHMQMLGAQYFDKIFNSEHKDKIPELGKILLDNDMFFMPTAYCDAFLDGEITKEEFILGHKVFSWPIEPQIGLPALAIRLRFGEDCKINKSVSSRGEREEWTYYGEHKEMKRNVIAYEFKFVDGKLDAYEDKTDNCYFRPIFYASYENELSTCTTGSITWSRNIMAGVGDKEDEWIQGILDLVHKQTMEKVDGFFVKDSDLDRHIESFEPYNDSGQYDLSKSSDYLNKLRGYVEGEEHELHAHEIKHAITVLSNAAANNDSLKESGQKFVDRYAELTDLRMNQIEMLSVAELKEIGYEFDNADNEARYSKLYDGAVEKYRSEIPKEPPFTAEVEEFKVALETYKNKQCVVATAAVGDRNHYIIKDLRYFRDHSLSHLKSGKLFIKYYYKVGPYYANVIKNSYILRKLTLEFLIKPIHSLVKNNKVK